MLLSEMSVAEIRAAKPKVRSLATQEEGVVYQVVTTDPGSWGALIAIQWYPSGRVLSIGHRSANTIEVLPPYWRIGELHNGSRPIGNLIWEINGHFGNAVAGSQPRARLAIAPAVFLLMIEPEMLMNALILMRDNMSERKLYFRNREEFEQAQLKLEELIRQYSNLV